MLIDSPGAHGRELDSGLPYFWTDKNVMTVAAPPEFDGPLGRVRAAGRKALRSMRHVGRGALRRGPARAPEPPVPDPTSGRDEQISAYLRDHHVRCLQIGAGRKHIEGWLSTDLTPGDQDTIFLDATEPFPFPDDCLDFVFGEHLIEHVSWWDGQRVLAECRRVLRPGGVLRLATPDAARLIDLYRGEAGAEGEHYLQWHHKRFTPLMRTHPLVVLNHNVRAWGHVFLYDSELLSAALGDAGFEQITPCEMGDSTHPALRGVEQHHRGGGQSKERAVRFETMCFEATSAN